MNQGANRYDWSLDKKKRNCCALCLEIGRPIPEARACDGVHFHNGCGGQMHMSAGTIGCNRGHGSIAVYSTRWSKTEAETRAIPRNKVAPDFNPFLY